VREIFSRGMGQRVDLWGNGCYSPGMTGGGTEVRGVLLGSNKSTRIFLFGGGTAGDDPRGDWAAEKWSTGIRGRAGGRAIPRSAQ